MTAKDPGPKARKAIAPAPGSVEALLKTLHHPAEKEIRAVREILLAADPSITEGVKWKAPSFRTSEYFATVNLREKRGVGLILHFGAKKNAISASGVAIADPESMVEWLGKDRAVVTFRDLEDIAARRPAFTELIREWIRHV